MPRVSVVMAARDEEGTIVDAIAGIVAQTFRDFEIVFVDDGSRDRTAQLVAGYGDPRIRLIRQERLGHPAALNRGIAASSGELIARHDADDLSLPERFGRQVAFLDAHPEVALVGTAAILRDARGHDRVFSPPTSDWHIRLAMASGNPIVSSGVMMRRSALDTAGPYADLRFEDYDLWIRIAASYRVANLPEVLVIRHVREGSRGRAGRRTLALRDKLRLQQQAIRRLGLPATAHLGLVRTLGGVAVYALLERMRPVGAADSARPA